MSPTKSGTPNLSSPPLRTLEDEIREKGGTTGRRRNSSHHPGEIDRLSQVNEEYLSYARLPVPKKQLIDPEAEVNAVVSMLLPEMKRRNINVEVLCLEELPPIFIDRGQFKQLLINLITNAEDAMPSGGNLELNLLSIKDNFLLLVKDTGYGIPQELTRRIFDPYFTTKDNGTGLAGPGPVHSQCSRRWVDVETRRGRLNFHLLHTDPPSSDSKKERCPCHEKVILAVFTILSIRRHCMPPACSAPSADVAEAYLLSGARAPCWNT
jgi:hypothetical protein